MTLNCEQHERCNHLNLSKSVNQLYKSEQSFNLIQFTVEEQSDFLV